MKQLPFRHVALLLVVTLIVFANSLANGFVWDDFLYIVRNDFVKKLDLVRLLTSFSSNEIGEYFPVRDITVALDYSIWRENPLGFHLTNLLLYCLNVVAVYVLTREVTLLLRRDDQPASDASLPATALLAAILFAVHPLHCEVVAVVFNRGALLAGLFFFAACIFFLRFLRHDNRKLARYGGALACFLLALLSKHYVIILPLLLAYFVCFTGRGRRRTAVVVAILPFLAMAASFYVFFKVTALRTGYINPEFARLATADIGATIAKALQIPFFYLKLLIVPAGFSAVYETRFSSSLASPQTILSLLAYGVIFFAAVRLRRRFPELLFAFGWFLVTLIPVLNFFNTTPVVADRYAYIPSYGFFYLLAVPLARMAAGSRARFAFFLAGLLVLVWGGVAIRQNQVWRDSISLWSDVVRKFPAQEGAYLNLGTAYFEQGDSEKALFNYRKAQELSGGGDFMAIYSEGNVHVRKGDYQAGIDCFRRALALDEDYLDANFALASAYERVGNMEKAIYHYNRVLYSPYVDLENFKVRARLKVSLLTRNVPRLVSLQREAAARPDNLDLRKDLALTLDTLGMYDEALAGYLELERHGGGRWQLYFNIANVLKHLQRKREAVAYFEKCLVLNPSYADGWNSLGTVYDSLGEGERAIAAFRKAVESDPEFSYPYFNLAKAYLKARDTRSARYYFAEIQRKFPALRPQVAPYLKQLD